MILQDTMSFKFVITGHELSESEECEHILTKLVENTYNNTVEQLCRVHTSLTRIVTRNQHTENRMDVLEVS